MPGIHISNNNMERNTRYRQQGQLESGLYKNKARGIGFLDGSVHEIDDDAVIWLN